jgi:hypothetical protein
MRPMILALVACPLLCVGQEASSIRVTEGGGPVRLAGTVRLTELSPEGSGYACHVSITLTNISPKPIQLMISRILVPAMTPDSNETKPPSPTTGERLGTRSDDYFFAQALLQPQEIQKWDDYLPPFSNVRSRSDALSLRPLPEAQVIFVQFEDGSTWGDLSAAETALRQRELSFHKLTTLIAAYDKEGAGAFVSDLLKPTDLPLILQLQEKYRTERDASRLIQVVRSKHANGEGRIGRRPK